MVVDFISSMLPLKFSPTAVLIFEMYRGCCWDLLLLIDLLKDGVFIDSLYCLLCLAMRVKADVVIDVCLCRLISSALVILYEELLSSSGAELDSC